MASLRPAARFVNPLPSESPHSDLVASLGLTFHCVQRATKVVPTTKRPSLPVNEVDDVIGVSPYEAVCNVLRFSYAAQRAGLQGTPVLEALIRDLVSLD